MAKFTASRSLLGPLLGLLLLCGCGADRAQFEGIWTPQSGGTTTFTCEQRVISLPYTNDLAIGEGSSSDLIASDRPLDSCTIKFDISDGTATAPAGQSCTSMALGFTLTFQYSAFVLTVSDGKTLTLANAGAGTATNGMGAMGSCSLVTAATLTRKGAM